MEKTSEVTKRLGAAYKAWKEGEKEKDKARKEFFQLADEMVRESLARERVQVWGQNEDDAFLRAQEQYPGWQIQDRRQVEDGVWEFIIEEDPTFKPFTFVNPDDGQVYQRQVSAGSINLDEEAIKTRNPELYEAVTYVPQERVMKSLDELEPQEMAALQEFLYEGKPKVKLAPPRKAKPEELMS